MTHQTKTNKLNYLIDPTFNEVNRLFVLLFQRRQNIFFKVLDSLILC